MKISGHGGKDAPFIEGAFMNKWNGKYYLQYASPATEVSTYGDGVYVGDGPLGPFTYQAHNPYSFKPGGFITGAGHGSTIEDKFGNLWHAATMRISVNANFERRIGLFPAGLDADGILFCNQCFADYPLEIPEGKFDPMSVKPKWMLLSYKKPVTASSYLADHAPELAVNEDIRTSWCAAGSAGEWLMLDLGAEYRVHAVQVNLADADVPVAKRPKSERSDITSSSRWIDLIPYRRTRWLLEWSADGENWEILIDKREAGIDLSNDYIELETPATLRYLRLTAVELPYGEKFAVSGLRVFGEGNRESPAPVTECRAIRLDDMTRKLHWAPSDGATGYNVRYGIAPEKLYSSFLVYENSNVILSSLTKGQTYYAAVDAFNESGITEGKTVKL